VGSLFWADNNLGKDGPLVVAKLLTHHRNGEGLIQGFALRNHIEPNRYNEGNRAVDFVTSWVSQKEKSPRLAVSSKQEETSASRSLPNPRNLAAAGLVTSGKFEIPQGTSAALQILSYMARPTRKCPRCSQSMRFEVSAPRIGEDVYVHFFSCGVCEHIETKEIGTRPARRLKEKERAISQVQ
jgi:hypothetical protein